jgi:hypothetical protein
MYGLPTVPRLPAAAHLAAGLAALAACSSPEPVRSSAGGPPRDELRVAYGRAADDARLVVELGAARAEVRGVWLDTGDGARTWELLDWQTEADAQVGRCASPPDHALRLVVRRLGPRRLQVLVEDRIGVRVAVAGLGLVWTFTADGPPEEVEAPLLHGEPPGLAGDVAFRAPLAYVRSGRHAFALEPDLEALATSRRLPQALRIEPLATGASVLHAATAQTVEVDAHSARVRRDPRAAIRVRNELLRLVHELELDDRAEPRTTLAALRRSTWERLVTPRLRRGDIGPGDRSWAELADRALGDRLARDLRTLPRRGGPTAYLVEPGVAAGGFELARLSAGDNMLRDALVAARVAARRGDPALRDQAVQLTRFALDAPRRAGLTPHAFRLRRSDGQLEWVPGDPDGPRPDAFDAADAAATAVLAIELAGLLPELDGPIRNATATLANFLRQSQRGDGALAGVFDREHLAPVFLAEDARAGATAGPAAFLAEFAAWTGNADARAAAARAVRFVHRAAIEAGGPLANPSRFRPTFRDPGTGIPVRDLLPMAAAARAATTLAASDPDFVQVARDFLDALGALQQVWDPPWLPGEFAGGFGGSNADATWNAPGQAEAARAMLDAYRIFGRIELLERGAAALRCALAEPLPSIPGLARRGDPLPALLAALAAAERCRAVLGQGVIDLDQRGAVGIDALWFEPGVPGGTAVPIEARTRAPDLAEAEVWIRAADRGALQALRSGTELLLAAPGRRPVPVRRVPRLELRPPAMVAAERDWRPLARIVGPVPEGASVWLEVRPGREPALRLPMVPSGEAGLWIAAEPFRPAASLRGQDLQLELRCRIDRLVLRAPPTGPVEVRVADFACIDPGDDLETRLVSASPGARVVRFVDGREYAREVGGAETFTYAVPVPAEAATVDLRILSSGALLVAGGPDGRALHEDQTLAPDGDRLVQLRLSDPRLWPEGSLALSFRAAGDRASVARIEYRTTGVAERALAGAPARPLAAPDLRVELLVLPLGLAGAPAPDSELLRQALVGGAEYRVTPSPEPRPTSGSLAHWVATVSGGRTAVTADLLEPLSIDRALAEPDEAGQEPIVVEQLRPALSAALQARSAAIDAILVVHPGSPASAPTDLAIDSVPIVVLSEREQDGSYLSVGRLAATLLTRLRGLEDLGTAEAGAFGSLSLTADPNRHTPPVPAGINLLRTGWASVVDILPGRPTRGLRLPPLIDGRTVLRVTTPGIDATPELLVETRRVSSTDPSPRPSGLSIYWNFAAEQAPVIRLLDGRSVRPRHWRLSPSTPSLRTPFGPGGVADLFFDTTRLDDRTPPSLATPRGETPWTVERLDLLGGATAALDLRWQGLDLLRDVRQGWAGGADGGIGPLLAGAPDAGAGRVIGSAASPRLGLPDRPGGLVRGRFEIGPSESGRRLFVELREPADGRLDLGLGLDGRSLLRAPVPAEGLRATVDLPPTQSRWLEIDLHRLGGAPSVQVASAVLLPRSAGAAPIALDPARSTAARLSDGAVHAPTHPLLLDERGRARLQVPVLLPSSRGALRLVCATGHLRGEACRLRIELRFAGGGPPVLLHDRLEVPASTDRAVPLTVLLCELPEADDRGLAFLELGVDGPRGAVLHLRTLEIDRP